MKIEEKRVPPRRVLTRYGHGTLHVEGNPASFVELDKPTLDSHCGFFNSEPILPIDGRQKGLWLENGEITELPQ